MRTTTPAIRFGTGLGLVAVGAILAYATANTTFAGISLPVVGAILMVTGVIALGIAIGMAVLDRSPTHEYTEERVTALDGQMTRPLASSRTERYVSAGP